MERLEVDGDFIAAGNWKVYPLHPLIPPEANNATILL
jgi:hypothetical protein